MGIKFRRQHPIGRFVVDFYSPEAHLVIELDGPVHEVGREEDAARQRYLEQRHCKGIRFENDRVLHNTDDVVAQIVMELRRYRIASR